MTFVHHDPEIDALVRIVAGQRGLSLALVEKDYWVTHALSTATSHPAPMATRSLTH